MSADRPTAVVVDDATVIRESLPLLMTGIDVVGRYATVEQMLEAAPEADVVILDLHLSNASQPDVRQGIAAVRAVVAAGYRVCVFSQEERRFVLAACLAAGASGIVAKSEGTAATEEAFAAVAAGEVVMPQALIGLVEVLVRRNNLTILSERQRQVLSGRARGFTYAELGEQLFLSESTLRGYWATVTETVADYLASATPADIEHALGVGPGDLLDLWPEPPEESTAVGRSPQRWWQLRAKKRRR